MQQLYEEIKEPDRGGVAMRTIVPSAPANASPYEEIIPAGGKVVQTKTSDAYEITQCSAYGVSLTK